MSINDSIFAGVGRPPRFATAVRIPIHGPFNTLVVVHLKGASVMPGIQVNNCDMTRFNLSFPSNFVLVGYDQRSPPTFQHSTAGFLQYVATGNDATFTYAIDVVSAHFDEVGRYWVDYSAAMHNDCEVSAGDCTLTSWVLVNEPPIEQHALRHPWALSSSIRVESSHVAFPLMLAQAKKHEAHPCTCD